MRPGGKGEKKGRSVHYPRRDKRLQTLQGRCGFDGEKIKGKKLRLQREAPNTDSKKKEKARRGRETPWELKGVIVRCVADQIWLPKEKRPIYVREVPANSGEKEMPICPQTAWPEGLTEPGKLEAIDEQGESPEQSKPIEGTKKQKGGGKRC